ncbi:hypothetical protein ACLB2K_049876 [Fragaria x ananassa]
MTNSSAPFSPDTIRAPTRHAFSEFFYAEISIGSPPVTVYLALDTGSTPTWVQDETCVDCIEVSSRMYNRLASATYQAMKSDHPLCVPPHLSHDGFGYCIYEINFADDSFTRGGFALDVFFFLDENGQKQAIQNVAFGLGIYNKMDFSDLFHGQPNLISGILGLGKGDPTSIIRQLRSITLLKFSYCLPLQFEDQALLHFGDDAQLTGPNVRSTQFLGDQSNHYFLKLNGISLNGALLQIDPNLFMAGGGMVIDSGAPYSYIVEEAFLIVKQAVAEYFRNKYGWEPLEKSEAGHGFDLCYQIRTVYTVPSMTLHFEGADLELERRTLLVDMEQHDEVCMAIFQMPGGGLNVLGAAQQANHRFLFDAGSADLDVLNSFKFGFLRHGWHSNLSH